ncbi:Xyloglucan galactosyltransferase KATAMARI1 [Hibiscus syriacus]|uniref:Xyloglucan galactosyltransferase KATAMARI1 n=1 Tax=Hibiscus syriacus TaxID=106335 RepID=A0A6A3AVH1_HIBSY|nr:Xyloglucan galactosyltransferase KATAMARI1 [Hibiscus syriacus]
MEDPITAKCCTDQPWFVLLVFFVFCLELLCFDYSGFTAKKSGAVSVLDDSHGNLVDTQSYLPHDFTETSNNSISQLPKTDESVKMADRDEELKVVTEVDSCLGRYVFVHDLPSRFNEDLVKNCWLLTRGTDKNMCPYLDNLGFGPEIDNPENVLMNNSWFLTNQFLLEVIFHNRMKRYECLTNDSSIASAVFVPFYAGLDMSLYLWGFNITVRDSASLALVKWLSEKPEWKRMWGRDHFLVAGRIAWDFRRQSDNESDWGSKLGFLPESKNMSILSIESSSWNNDYAIPYPTCFHPSKDSEIFQWQDRMRMQKRRYLFSFAGAPRPEYQNSIRGKIIDQCLASKNRCKMLDCNYGATNCDNPVNVMRNIGLERGVIKLVPRMVYAGSRSRSETLEDSFDLAVKGVLERIDGVRGMIREGKDSSIGFADADDYKYTFPPYGDGI